MVMHCMAVSAWAVRLACLPVMAVAFHTSVHIGKGDLHSHSALTSFSRPTIRSGISITSDSASAMRMAGDGDLDMSAFFAEVEKRDEAAESGEPMDGPELRSLVMDKWKYPLDTRIHRRRDAFGKQTVWLQVMWKHLWEQSFPLTEEEYDAQLDAVAWYVTEWGKADYVRDEIKNSEKEPGLTVNGGAKTVLINLQISEEQARMLFDDV